MTERVSQPVAILLNRISHAGLPTPVLEHRFARPMRQFRFDLCWPEYGIAAEVDGGTWTGGRHTRGRGFETDCRKLNLAIQLGWRVLRFTPAMIESQEAVAVLGTLLRPAPTGATEA